MTLRFAVVHEAEADFDAATSLADRVLEDSIEWLKLDPDLLPHQREWISAASAGRRLTWKAIPQLARELGIKAHGHFGGEPALPDAAAARRAILYLTEAIPELHAIVLVRDQDDQPERKDGLNQARNVYRGKATIVIGLAVVERESWVISGFETQDDDEKSRLDAERARLGFNPCERSHELTACKNDQAPRSPKRVLRSLSSGDPDREQRCLSHTPLGRLRDRGTENGLAAFLDEVRNRLAPRIGHVADR